jgi:hypothetical protein
MRYDTIWGFVLAAFAIVVMVGFIYRWSKRQ